MKKDSGLYKLVYEYYEARILFGFYREGDALPSIQKICGVFRLAPATVRTALSQLEKNGYVKIEARKTARVVYRVPAARFRENAARYFVPRRQGIADLMQSGALLFEPLWEAGLRRWDAQSWATLRRELARPMPGAVSMPVEFYLLVLGALDNRLILNLYWEAIRYLRFPYLSDEKTWAVEPERLETLSEDATISFLKQQLSDAYRQSTAALGEFMEQAGTEYDLEREPTVPFVWEIYRKRPQVRYTLVSRIIREILSGRYAVGCYLPSLPEMAEQYGVALHTVRRTLEILNGLGVTRTFHGKGTLVCMDHLKIDLTKMEIREGMELYVEGLELLAMTIEPVALFTLQAVSKEKRDALTQEFVSLRSRERGDLCFETCLSFIEDQCPLALVRECYRKLREVLVWGYPLARLRRNEQGLHGEYAAFIEKAERQLRQGNLPGFAQTWKSLMEREHQHVCAYMRQLRTRPGALARRKSV